MSIKILYSYVNKEYRVNKNNMYMLFYDTVIEAWATTQKLPSLEIVKFCVAVWLLLCFSMANARPKTVKGGKRVTHTSQSRNL